MARKFFNQKVKKSKKKRRTTTIIASILGVLILIVLTVIIITLINNKHKNAVIVPRDKVAVEVNTDYPDKTLFFAELKDVKEKDIKPNYDKVDLTKVGSYKITLKVYGKKYISILEVVDTQAPTVELKELNISPGEKYSAKDFVAKCSDNSKEECIIDFYDLSVDQKGNSIDYSSYTKEGSYTIQIVARDKSGNVSTPVTTRLSIGNFENKPKVCNFGNNDYDKNKYTLAVDVTEDGCAIDLNLYQNQALVAPVHTLLENEKKKLANEFKKIKLNTKDIYLNSRINPVLNNQGIGIVGYTLYIEVALKKDSQDIIESYYVTQDGKRNFLINKYL